ncbi:DUF4157 domain-containing protein [Streptomyces bambusae]|uniref:eCIS core domain-containing protein n=1 Tax=Streptomyces bambusae TaxID=1550616 RepID=UPI001CFF4032|nr:DUF4157 domain-containing protein [Streptomyces bambusae]MCB5168483.1 DUF4157 domain-containing protein [Streptomyces bambusae]
MHGHTHDHDEDTETAATRRPEGAPVQDHLLAQAAAAGRTDVLGPAGMLRLQRTLGNARTASVQRSSVHDVVATGGTALDPEVRDDMESRLGHDFGDVRVHTDAAAHDSAKSVNAHAYTVGSHIVFQRDAYDPGSQQGRTTLAHELTHVVQQRSGPVDGTDAGGGIRVSDPGDRFEREAVATAERVMSAPAPAPAPAPAGAVQREAESGGVGAGGEVAVQRAAEAEEEEAPAE